MKKYFVHALLTVVLLAGLSVAQGTREAKPVTAASLCRSLLTLANKAELAGRDKDAAIIMQAAARIMAEGK